jgi:hypothetical protein
VTFDCLCVLQDAHLSEYVNPAFQRRGSALVINVILTLGPRRAGFISGFTGSAGTAVVTHTEAKLWTDGRYYLQAHDELGEDWGLMRLEDTPLEVSKPWPRVCRRSSNHKDWREP